MTVELKDVRRVAVLTWDTSIVMGSDASIQVGGEEKRNVKNDGETNVFYPLDGQEYTADVVVRGSASGEDTGTVTIPGDEDATANQAEAPE